MRYHQVQSGEWVQPKHDGYYMKCCDCGLVHKMKFKVVKGHVFLSAIRIRRRKKS